MAYSANNTFLLDMLVRAPRRCRSSPPAARSRQGPRAARSPSEIHRNTGEKSFPRKATEIVVALQTSSNIFGNFWELSRNPVLQFPARIAINLASRFEAVPWCVFRFFVVWHRRSLTREFPGTPGLY